MKTFIVFLFAAVTSFSMLTSKACADIAQTGLARGINITRWWSHPEKKPFKYYDEYMDLGTLKKLKGLGFDYIRLPASPSALDWKSKNSKAELIQYLVDSIALIRESGLAVVLCFMKESMALETDVEDRTAYIELLMRTLSAIENKVGIKGFYLEILNEPNFRDDRKWYSFQDSVIQEIRQKWPFVGLIAVANRWDSAAALEKVDSVRRDVLWGVHLYEPAFFTSMEAEFDQEHRSLIPKIEYPFKKHTCSFVSKSDVSMFARMLRFYCSQRHDASTTSAYIRGIAEWRDRERVAVIATEIGVRGDRSSEARAAFFHDLRRALEENDVGWALWGYDDAFGFGINHADQKTMEVPKELLRSLGLNSR